MNYTSAQFWLLFAVLLPAYGRLDRRRQNRLLLVASYLFYGFWDYRFLFLILVSTAVDFIGGLGVAGVRLPSRRLWGLAGLLVGGALLLCTGVRYADLFRGLLATDPAAALGALPRRVDDFAIPIATALVCLAYGSALPALYAARPTVRRKAFLTISMVANLGILGFFKYCDFFLDSLQAAVQALGLPALPVGALGLILPAGISFYTFQAMSYTIDIYRGDAEPTDDLGDFSLFICFFPHLVAGPIMRAHTLLPQVVGARPARRPDWEGGFWLVLIGLFKKVVVADNAAAVADAVFLPFAHSAAPGVTGPEVLVGVYAFAVQIYADFSGYSAVARGVSKWLGYELVVNFDQPYAAVSPSDFWRRWHISLSTWLRDYLYVPLGGSRHGTAATYRNLMLTMLLGGLWHGASWTFVAWGVYHGAILVAYRAAGVSDAVVSATYLGKLHRLARVAVMFHLTCLGWLLFRADSLATCARMGRLLLTDARATPFAASALVFLLFHAAPLFLLERATGGERRLTRLVDGHWLLKGFVAAYLVLMILLFRAASTHDFIYFQF